MPLLPSGSWLPRPGATWLCSSLEVISGKEFFLFLFFAKRATRALGCAVKWLCSRGLRQGMPRVLLAAPSHKTPVIAARVGSRLRGCLRVSHFPSISCVSHG